MNSQSNLHDNQIQGAGNPNFCLGFHSEENGTHFCIEHDCFLCDKCMQEHAGHIGCDSVINILT